MALPAEWATRTVERIYRDWEGNPLTGEVSFIANVPVENEDESIVILPKKLSAELDGTGKLTIELPVTDDTDMRNYGFTYQVTEALTYAGGASYSNTYNVYIPSDTEPDPGDWSPLQLGAQAPVPAGAGIVIVDGLEGPEGPAGPEGPEGPAGDDGADGADAFEVWLAQPGNAGLTFADWQLSLKGDAGDVSGLATVATSGSVADLVDYVAPIPAGDTQTQGILAAKVLVACDYNTGTSTWDAAPDSRLRRVFQSTAANDPAALSQERDIWIVEAS